MANQQGITVIVDAYQGFSNEGRISVNGTVVATLPGEGRGNLHDVAIAINSLRMRLASLGVSGLQQFTSLTEFYSFSSANPQVMTVLAVQELLMPFSDRVQVQTSVKTSDGGFD